MGEVERATRDQCAASSTAAEKAGIVAAAIALSKLIDDPDYAAQLGQNVTRLEKLLATLGKPKKKSGGRLSVVSQMAGRRNAI